MPELAVLSGLILTAFLMGLAGAPHCAAMCGAPCAAALPAGVPVPSLLGRCIGYGLLGAVAAASAGTVAQWGREFAFVQPLWVLLQAMAVLLGVCLMGAGRMPGQVDAWGQALYRRFQARWAGRFATWPNPVWSGALWPVLWPVLAGMAWAILPCGLLYAAVMVAVLAPSAWGGALVMLAFAVPSAVGVWVAPALFRRLLKRGDNTHCQEPSMAVGVVAAAVPVIWLRQAQGLHPNAVPMAAVVMPSTRRNPRWAVRLAGLMLAVMSSWALYHQILAQWQAWCG